MYEALLQLPLFQGLCTDDFTRIIEKVKFHFRSYSGNEIIMNQGATCPRVLQQVLDSAQATPRRH